MFMSLSAVHAVTLLHCNVATMVWRTELYLCAAPSLDTCYALSTYKHVSETSVRADKRERLVTVSQSTEGRDAFKRERLRVQGGLALGALTSARPVSGGSRRGGRGP